MRDRLDTVSLRTALIQVYLLSNGGSLQREPHYGKTRENLIIKLNNKLFKLV